MKTFAICCAQGRILRQTAVSLLVFALSVCLPAILAHAESFESMVAETGCDSRFSEQKKADLFANNYQGKEITLTGEIYSVRGPSVQIDPPVNGVSLVSVSITNEKATYDLETGQQITVRFIVRDQGWFCSYDGDEGIILSVK